MKAYLLFSGDNYYPSGGISDYKGDFDSLDEAVTAFENGYYSEWDTDREHVRYNDWYQVVQSNDMSEVTSGYK